MKNKKYPKLLSFLLLCGILAGCGSTINKNQSVLSNIDTVVPIMRDEQLSAPLFLENFPNQIALLLPMSGEYQREGESILHGFLSAHYSLNQNNIGAKKIKIYDTQKFLTSEIAYSQAVNEGADFVVGPLLPNSVKELSNRIAFNVPILTLNSLKVDESLIGMYQFSLSSTDEAISTSSKVIIDRNKVGLILAPDNEWGKQLEAIYKGTFQSMDGVIVESKFYDPKKKDFSSELKSSLGISLSEKRYSRLSANLREKIIYNPRRRQDIDFIFFVAADTTTAKLLKSQLNYHLSGDKAIPIYSTSTIYSDNTNLDDLNGIIFTDAPWVIDQQTWLGNLPSLLRKYWPGDAIQSRQNAMGYDAYFLMAAINSMKNNYMEELNGATGQLFMEEDGKIRRRLAWAKLIDGKPKIQKRIQEVENLIY